MGGIDEHQLDEYGDHEPEECEVCIERDESVVCDCRCGLCCQSLIIEVSIRDGLREPLIQERGSPIFDDLSGTRVQVGWILNTSASGACTFFDSENRACTIYETRPLACRVFDCGKWLAGEEQ